MYSRLPLDDGKPLDEGKLSAIQFRKFKNENKQKAVKQQQLFISNDQ